jgi:hypothetical protein
MKKKKYLTLILIFASLTNVNAQECNYKINETDKFTKKFTKLTKSEKVIGTFFTTGLFSVKKIDASYFFIFDYGLSSYSNFDPYSIKKPAQLIFLLENGETVTLNSADDINGTKKITISLPPVYSCYLTNVSYPVSENQIEQFFKSKVKSIRFYRTESNGKEDYLDNEIKKRNQDDIQNLIKCVM